MLETDRSTDHRLRDSRCLVGPCLGGDCVGDQLLEVSRHGLDDLSEEMRILLNDGGDLLGQRADAAAGP
ncbi:hypothetical protein ACFW20_08750 [Streptomyces nigra]|uniref:hypothetical protein n=1 Tax=Streptomyces nigra TaxID=1827580 RepID=UPI0034130E47